MEINDTAIFVGLKITERLSEQLDSSNASVKQFFEGNNPEHLQVMQIEQHDYIGKITRNKASLEELSNILMNVKTMLRMICPKFSFPDNTIKVLAVVLRAESAYL